RLDHGTKNWRQMSSVSDEGLMVQKARQPAHAIERVGKELERGGYGIKQASIPKSRLGAQSVLRTSEGIDFSAVVGTNRNFRSIAEQHTHGGAVFAKHALHMASVDNERAMYPGKLRRIEP